MPPHRGPGPGGRAAPVRRRGGDPPTDRGQRPDELGLGLGLGGGAAPGELDGVVPAVGARVVLGQRIAALAADAAGREALLPALAGSGVGSGALYRASLGAHGNPRSSAGQACRPGRRGDDLKVCHLVPDGAKPPPPNRQVSGSAARCRSRPRQPCRGTGGPRPGRWWPGRGMEVVGAEAARGDVAAQGPSGPTVAWPQSSTTTLSMTSTRSSPTALTVP